MIRNIKIILLLCFLTHLHSSQTWTYYPEDYSSYDYTTYTQNEYFIDSFYPNESNRIINDLRNGIRKYPLNARRFVTYSIYL